MVNRKGKPRKKKSLKKKIIGKGIIKITRPYINKENKLMLGEGKKKYKKQKGKGIATILSAVAPYALIYLVKFLHKK